MHMRTFWHTQKPAGYDFEKVGYVLPAYSDVGRTYAVHPPVVFYPACPIARVFLGAKGAYAGMLNCIVHVLLVTHTRPKP